MGQGNSLAFTEESWKRPLKGSEMKLQLSEFFNEFCFLLRVHELALSSVPAR